MICQVKWILLIPGLILFIHGVGGVQSIIGGDMHYTRMETLAIYQASNWHKLSAWSDGLGHIYVLKDWGIEGLEDYNHMPRCTVQLAIHQCQHSHVRIACHPRYIVHWTLSTMRYEIRIYCKLKLLHSVNSGKELPPSVYLWPGCTANARWPGPELCDTQCILSNAA